MFERDVELRKRNELGDPSGILRAPMGPDIVADEVFGLRLSCESALHQVPEVERAMPERPQLPSRRLGREQRGGLVPVVEVLDRDRLLPAGDA